MSQTIQHDLKCITCGYNLRTLDPASVCPECGRKIEWSLHGHRMIFVPSPRQRFCLTWGPRAINVAFLITSAIASWRPRRDTPYDELEWFGLPASLFALGVWGCTAPIPRRDGPEIGFIIRWCARLLSLVPLLAVLMWQIGYAWVPWDQGDRWMYWTEMWPPFFFFSLAALCGYIARIARGLSAHFTSSLAIVCAVGALSAGLMQFGVYPFRYHFPFPAQPIFYALGGCFGFLSIGAAAIPLLLMVWPDQIASIPESKGVRMHF